MKTTSPEVAINNKIYFCINVSSMKGPLILICRACRCMKQTADNSCMCACMHRADCLCKTHIFHLLVKVHGVAREGRVVDEVEPCPVLRNVALVKQLFPHVHVRVCMKHPAVPQAVDHEDQVVVELAESVAADVKGLLGLGIRINKLLFEFNFHGVFFC